MSGSDDIIQPREGRSAFLEGDFEADDRKLVDRKSDLQTMYDNARTATDKEHKMSLMEGVRQYPKAVGWSLLISSCIIMEGYDVSLVGNFYAFDTFNRKYGVLTPDGTYQVPAPWQAGLSNGCQVGEILGLFLAGIATERFGYRYTLIGALILVTGFIAIFFTAQNIQTLLVAEILAGIPWGCFQTVTISYASEVVPVALRGYLTCYVNMCWGIGQLIGVGVIKAMLPRTDSSAYKIPYGLQWMWPVPLMIGIFLAPESAWWLVRHGHLDKAKHSLSRLSSNRTSQELDETIDMMRHTTALEKEITTGASYLDCFRGVNLRRTEIVCMVWAIQVLSGNSFSNYSTYFLVQAGLDPGNSYSFALGQYGFNVVGVFGAWGLMALGVGRRRLFIVGLAGLCVALFVMGCMTFVEDKKTASLAAGVMMLVWALFYQCSVGTIAYSLVAEMSTRRLQVKTVVIGRNLYNVAAIVSNVLTPYMINPTAWNWNLKAGFFWSGSCLLCIIYAYFRVPEPSGRTFAELDILFEKKISARQFATANVDAFDHVLDGHKSSVEHVERT